MGKRGPQKIEAAKIAIGNRRPESGRLVLGDMERERGGDFSDRRVSKEGSRRG